MTLPADDPRHGTYNGYVYHGCRCDRCRRAHADYQRERRHRLGLQRPWAEYVAERRANLAPHGTETRYSYGCRCELCRHAASEARKRRRHANPEATRDYERRQKRARRAALRDG